METSVPTAEEFLDRVESSPSCEELVKICICHLEKGRPSVNVMSFDHFTVAAVIRIFRRNGFVVERSSCPETYDTYIRISIE